MGAFKSIVNFDFINPENLLAEAVPLPLNHENQAYTVVASRSHLSKETETYVQNLRTKHGKIEFISIGSSLKLCMVAEGKANCYQDLHQLWNGTQRLDKLFAKLRDFRL